MEKLKATVFGVILGMAVGLWFGVNLGKGRSIVSNPFAEDTLQDQIKQTGEQILQKGGEVIEKGGQKIEQGGRAMQKKLQEK